jgi:hypothetical protein
MVLIQSLGGVPERKLNRDVNLFQVPFDCSKGIRGINAFRQVLGDVSEKE